jgi:hypothetical protein
MDYKNLKLILKESKNYFLGKNEIILEALY